MPCGGRQRCLKCRVKASGELSPLTQRERELLTPEEIAAGVRFACMTELRGDARVELPAASAAQTHRHRRFHAGFPPLPLGKRGGRRGGYRHHHPGALFV